MAVAASADLTCLGSPEQPVDSVLIDGKVLETGKAVILHRFERKDPGQEYAYSFSPAREGVVEYLRTPAGTIVRSATYRRFDSGVRFLFWKFKRCEDYTTKECEPLYGSEAVSRLMKDTGMSAISAAKILGIELTSL